MNEEMTEIRNERDRVLPDSLDYLINTYLNKELLSPHKKAENMNQFCEKFFSLPSDETSIFPKLCSRLREIKSTGIPSLTMGEVKKMVHPLNVWNL